MLFSLYHKEVGFSPLCVCVFYDNETSLIRKLKDEDFQCELQEKYPGYSYLIMKRHNDYLDDALKDLARHDIVARLIPCEGNNDFLAPSISDKIDLDFFHCFMETLVYENSERSRRLYNKKYRDISELVLERLPEMYQTSDDVIEQMSQTFMSRIDKAINEANNVTIRVEKANCQKKVGNHLEKIEVCQSKLWSLVLEVDGIKYTLPIGAKKSLKTIFVYLLLHRNEEITGNNYSEAEARSIVRTLFQEENYNKINKILMDFDGIELSRKIGIMKRLVTENDNMMKVAPFAWIIKVKDSPNGTPELASWQFSPPDNVTIDTESFRQAMNEV